MATKNASEKNPLEKLLVRTPQTVDGVHALRDEETERTVFKDTILERTARPHFESLNNTIVKELKHQLFDVVVDKDGNVVSGLDEETAKKVGGKKGSAPKSDQN